MEIEINRDADNLNEWEQFIVEEKNGKYGFKSCHGKYLSAQSDGRIEINRDWCREWEMFVVTEIANYGPMEATIVSNSSMNVEEYDPNQQCKITLLGHHNKYLCAESGHNMVC